MTITRLTIKDDTTKIKEANGYHVRTAKYRRMPKRPIMRIKKKKKVIS